MDSTPYKSLPTMASLVAFVEAARALSFKRAAGRVHVSPSALTRQIQALEAQLGCTLFHRQASGLELTPEGARYEAVARACLNQLRDAHTALTPTSGPIRLSSLASFTEQWLIPRLPDLSRAHPDVQLEIEATLHYADLERDPVDAAIRFGTGEWGDLHAERLVELSVLPLCSPALSDGKRPLRAPEDLRHHTLIHVVQVPDWWQRWLDRVGISQLEPAGQLYFDHA